MSIFEVDYTRGKPESATGDPFVARFEAIPKKPRTPRRGNFPALLGDYETWRDFIRDAVAQDAAPSRELIKANTMLAAWEAHLGVTRVDSFPTSVATNITDVCNARCSFCAYVPERVSNQKVTLEQIQRADWLKFSRSFRPNGGGLGEPFAHAQIVEILQTVRRNAPFIWIDSITNGSLLRPKAVEAVAGFVQYFYVSINAARKQTYEETMRPLKWDTLIANLEHLAEVKARLGTDLPRLRAGYVCHRHNLDEVVEAPALLKRLGFEAMNLNLMLVPPPFESADAPLMTLEDTVHHNPEHTSAVFRQLEQECLNHGIALMNPLPSLSFLKTYRPESQGAL